jgi:hypothetical protein
MTAIKAIVKGRRLEVEVPADWLDGTEVEIHPAGQEARVDQGTMSTKEIASTLAAMDKMVPFEMTDAERAAWEAERRARKEWEKTHFAGQRLGTFGILAGNPEGPSSQVPATGILQEKQVAIKPGRPLYLLQLGTTPPAIRRALDKCIHAQPRTVARRVQDAARSEGGKAARRRKIS